MSELTGYFMAVILIGVVIGFCVGSLPQKYACHTAPLSEPPAMTAEATAKAIMTCRRYMMDHNEIKNARGEFINIQCTGTTIGVGEVPYGWGGLPKNKGN